MSFSCSRGNWLFFGSPGRFFSSPGWLDGSILHSMIVMGIIHIMIHYLGIQMPISGQTHTIIHWHGTNCRWSGLQYL